MKKRILAFALTLAMVVGSLSMLSFVTFAVEPEPATDFYAYRATLNVDAKLGIDELWVPVNKEIAPSVTVGMSWDYDNVYVVVYQEPSTNGVAGARVDYLKSAIVTIGGVEVNVDFAADPVVFGEIAGVKGAAGEQAGDKGYDFEIAVPLSEITLDETQLAAGVAALPVSFAITQMKGADAGSVAENLIEKDYNVILSGRSLITQKDDINPSGAYANATTMLNGGHLFCRSAGKYIGDADGRVNVTGITMAGAGGGTGGKVTITDASLYDGKVEAQRLSTDIREYIAVADGGKSYIEYEFKVANLPANGTITKIEGIGGGVNTASSIVIYGGGTDSNTDYGVAGHQAYIFNDATNGLSIAYQASSGVKIVDLGLKDDKDTFWLGFNEISTSKIEIYVNDVLLAGDMIATANAPSGDNGYMAIASQRGHSGINGTEARGYSLDLDESGAIEDDEKIQFTFGATTVSNVADVDVATIASLTKNAKAAPSTVILANNTTPVNVASLAGVRATYDVNGETVSLLLNTVNLDKIILNVGGYETTVTYSVDKVTRPDTTSAVVDAASAAAGVKATVSNLTGNVTTVTFPVEQLIDAYINEEGNAAVDVEIYVEKYDKANDKDGRAECRTAGTFEGTVVLVPDTSINAYHQFVPNFSAAGGAITVGATETAGAGSYTWNLPAGTTALNLRRTFYLVDNDANHFHNKTARRAVTFTFAPTAMKAYEFNSYADIQYSVGLDDMAANYDTVQIAIHGGGAAGTNPQVIFYILNTVVGGKESLVISYENTSGEKFRVPLGVAPGAATSIDFMLTWNANNSGSIIAKVAGEVVANIEVDNIISRANVHFSSNNTSSGVYSSMLNNGGDTNAFSFAVTNFKYNYFDAAYPTASFFPATNDQILAMFNTKEVTSTGDIKLAYVQESEVAENKFDVRFIATINTLDAQFAGFEISVPGNAVVTKDTDTVYKSIFANVNGEIKQINAAEGEYFVALTVKDVPATGTVTFNVRPFFLDLEDDVMYGDEYTVTYTNGVFVSCEAGK